MSLITNEIHILDGFNKTIVVAAADRRISKLDGSHGGNHPKIFQLPYYDGTVSYFGLAEVAFPNGRNLRFWEFLPAFVNKQTGATTIREFAFQLRAELNSSIPDSVLRTTPSGFHICGYNRDGIPEFWFLTNIGGMDQFNYINLQPQYTEPSPDFLGRDARAGGWDGLNRQSMQNGVCFYRNGDMRAHVSAWEKLDQMLVEMSSFRDFKKLATPADLERWVKFKMEFIARFYKEFAQYQIIGGDIDVFCASRNLS